MRLYEPHVRPGFEWALPARDEDHEVLWSLDGTSRLATWRPMPVDLLKTGDSGERRAHADLPWLGGHVLVLRERAVTALRPLLDRAGELLALDCPDADLWLFNVLAVVDALDEDNCDLVRFDDGSILDVNRYAFRSRALTGLPLFKVPQLLRGPLFVTQEFADALTAAALSGPELALVWSDGAR